MARPIMPFAKIVWVALVAFGLATQIGLAGVSMSLAGEWRFKLDPDDGGLSGHWFENKLPDKIQLPGILEAQGYGDKISINTPWVLFLYDHQWYLRKDYADYTNDEHVKVP